MQTKRLKEILKVLTSVIKFDKTKPITALVSIIVEDGTCYLGATDLQTSIVARTECDTNISEVTVSMVDLFKLAKSFKGKELSLSQDDDFLFVNCDGQYKLPIQLDIDGTQVRLPISIVKQDNLAVVNELDKLVKRGSIVVGEDILDVYHFAEHKVITTDSDSLAATTFEAPPCFVDVPSFAIEKLAHLGKSVNVSIEDCRMYAQTDAYAFSTSWDTIGEFPSEEVKGFINIPTTANVNKEELLTIVRRFTSLKKDTIIFIHSKQELNIYDLKMNIKETLNYTGTLPDTTIVLDANRLLKVLRVMENDIGIGIYPKFMVLTDSIGSFAITGGTDE